MSALRKDSEEIVTDLINLLVDRYESGFAVFKELLQNADDARARRMVVRCHDGFTAASNPLLQAPAIVVFNDGPVTERDFDALEKASGGSKAEEGGKVGRFGLGQKSVFHLCDAFIAQAWMGNSAKPSFKLISPFEGIAQADNASGAWASLSSEDEAIFSEWAGGVGFDKGMTLYLPLRSEHLCAGEGYQLTSERWTPNSALADIAKEGELVGALACLRNLRELELVGPSGKHEAYRVKIKEGPLANPDDESREDTAISGSILKNGEPFATFCGVQSWAADGEAANLKDNDDWPFRLSVSGQRIREKAFPHGAVLLSNCPSIDRPKLRISEAVYLPVGHPLDELALPEDWGQVDLIAHGCFFPSSDRTRVLAGNDARIQDRWNRHLHAEATLPSALEALRSFLVTLPDTARQYQLIRTLKESSWWYEHRNLACSDKSLARAWGGEGKPNWQVVPSAVLRPIRVSDKTRVARLREVWPELGKWLADKGLLLAFGGSLSSTPLRWEDAELADLISDAGPAIFSSAVVADTVGEILETADRCGSVGARTREALATTFRLAAASEKDFARADSIKRLIPYLPSLQCFALPASVESRAIIAALVERSTLIPLKPSWLESPPPRQFDLAEARDLLAAFEDFVGNPSYADQATTLITMIIQSGPPIDRLANDPEASQLAVIDATCLQTEAQVRLTLRDISDLSKAGLLFTAQPLVQRDLLGEAMAAPRAYKVRLRQDTAPFPIGSNKQSVAEAVAKATEFGSEMSRGLLASELVSIAERSALRRLITGALNLSPSASLVDLGPLPSALSDLASRLLEERGDTFLVPPATSKQLNQSAKEVLGVETLEQSLLAEWLGSFDGDDLELNEQEAIALLTSKLDFELIAHLPVHQTTTGELRSILQGICQAKPDDVPHQLREWAPLVRYWNDPDAEAAQRKIVPHWNEQAQLTTALSSDNPASLSSLIAEAVIKCTELSETALESLRRTPWVSVGGSSLAPADILDLPDNLRAALRTLGIEKAFATFDDLPADLRSDDLLAKLRELKAFPSRADSLAMTGALAGEAGIAALGIDYENHEDDLVALGLNGALSGVPVLTLIQAASRDSISADEVGLFLAELRDATPRDIVDQLNALAGKVQTGATGEALRRIHVAMYNAHALKILEGGFLPADLLVPAESGEFKQAPTLALNAKGVELSQILSSTYARVLPELDDLVGEALQDSSSRLDFYESLGQELSRFEGRVPRDAILFVLALLGRSEEIRELASGWEGQVPFGRICQRLDECEPDLEREPGYFENHFQSLRWEITTAEGQAEVLSCAGSMCRVDLKGDEAWLVERRKLESYLDDGHWRHPWALTFAPATIRDEAHARQLLEEFIDQITLPLVVSMPAQKSLVLEKFGALFDDDQGTLEDTCADLKLVLHDRLRGLKIGSRTKEALRQFSRDRHDPHKSPQEASDTLWSAILDEEISRELLDAVRKEIRKLGYRPQQTLFELFQNAHDALENWSVVNGGRFRVEVRRDDNGGITHMRVVHWGRPINHLGNDRSLGEERLYRDDLANMLAIGHSAKEGAEQSGQFGLGFKTVHMLADSVNVASDRQIVATINAGMIPSSWGKGYATAERYRSKGMVPTLIEFDVSRPDDAEEALSKFKEAAGWLPAVTAMATIEILDGDEQAFGAERERTTENTTVVRLSGGELLIEIDLESGYRLYLSLDNVGPRPIEDAQQFWRLVPLYGLRRNGGWIMEGPFKVDPGRSHFSGSLDEQEAEFARLGRVLSERLIEVYDHLHQHWDAFASRLGMDVDGFEAFVDRLIDVLKLDAFEQGVERELHRIDRGLGALLRSRPVIRLIDGSRTTSGEDIATISGTLSDPQILGEAIKWAGDVFGTHSLLDAETASLIERIERRNLPTVGLIDCMSAQVADQKISPEQASVLGKVLSLRPLEDFEFRDKSEFREWARDLKFASEAEHYVAISQLGFPQSEDENECLRAGFAPASARLNAKYDQFGLLLAQAARGSAGYNEETYKKWAASADESPERQLAFLEFLCKQDAGTIRRLAAAAKWLPKGSNLLNYPLLDAIPERNLLIAALSSDEPLPTGPNEPETIGRADARDVLQDIANWWDDNRSALTDRYDRAVYPEDFEPAELTRGDARAWFTMLGLATFQTLGRIRPEQSRSFVQKGWQEGWWEELARVQQNDDLTPFAERLQEWSEPWQIEPQFMIWRRCLVDLCTAARYLEEYQRIFLRLPQIIKAEGTQSLRILMKPEQSDIAAKMGINAASLANSMGIGANWVVRELCRQGIYGDPDQASLAMPYGWSTAARVRKLFSDMGQGSVAHGVDEGRMLYCKVEALVGKDVAAFSGDGDLPLHIITTSKHRTELNEILYDAGGDEWTNQDFDEDENYEI